jgi:hypothetical protein
LLTRLLLYGYCIGTTSSRAIEKATYDSVAFRYLAADQHPDHDTIASFRQQHLDSLGGLFVQALRLCHKAGLVKLGNVAVDGTKILANASAHRSVTYLQLREREEYWRAAVARLLVEAEADREQLLPMAGSIRNSNGEYPQNMLADAGYWDTASLRELSGRGMQVLMSPDGELRPDQTLAATVPKNEEALRMRELLRSPVGRYLYRQRQTTVEPVFGSIKEARGLRRFRFRGFTRVQCEWKLICATHNLLKLFRHRVLARAY